MGHNKPPKVVNVLVSQDHFMKHIMAYATPNHTAKTVAKFLYKGYISIFRAINKLFSDLGVNFTSNIIQELCKLISIKKIKILLYYAQDNRHVECTHEAIRWMIGKLGEDHKAAQPTTCQRWYKPTTLQDQLWLGIAQIS